MATIGQIRKVDDFGKQLLEGEIATLSFSIKFTLQENPTRKSGNSNIPDYLILVKNAAGTPIQVGLVWKKTSKKIGASMTEYLSMSFDDPSFPKPLHVTAFENSEDTWNIVWNRPKVINSN